MSLAEFGVVLLTLSTATITVYLILYSNEDYLMKWLEEKRNVLKIKGYFEEFQSKNWRNQLRQLYRFWTTDYGVKVNEILATYIENGIMITEKERKEINKKIKEINRKIEKTLSDHDEIKAIRNEINEFEKRLLENEYLIEHNEEKMEWIMKMKNVLKERNKNKKQEKNIYGERVEEIIKRNKGKRSLKMMKEAKKIKKEMKKIDFLRKKEKQEMMELVILFENELMRKEKEWKENEKKEKAKKEEVIMRGILKEKM